MMKRTYLLVVVLVALRALGQAPPNDLFTNKVLIPSGQFVYSLEGSNVGASAETSAGEPAHRGASARRSVWWSWLAHADGYAVVDTTNSLISTRVGVYVGKELGRLYALDSLQDSGLPGAPDHHEFEATPLQPYEIAVDSEGEAPGSIRLDIRLYTTPWIRAHPQETTVVQGRPARLEVWAVGKRQLQYQWQHKDASLTAVYTNLPSQVDRVLNLPVTRKSDEGWYRVVVRNTYGQATSNPAWLGITEKPEITRHPAPRTVSVGDDPTFEAGAVPEPLWYQWQFRLTNQTVFANLPNQNAPQLWLSNVGTAEAGYYRLWVTNAAGDAFSDPALLTVVARPPIIVEAPQSQEAVRGDEVWFYVRAEGYEPITIQWWFRTSTNLLWEEVWSESYLHLPAVEKSDEGTYGVVVRNAYGVATTNALLTVNLRPPNDHFENRISFNQDESPAGGPWNWPVDAPSSRLLKGYNKNATTQAGEMNHFGQPPKYSVWWSFTPPVDGIVTVDLGGTDFRPVVEAYQGSLLSLLVPVAGSNSRSPFSFFARQGLEYPLVVDGWQEAYGTNVNIRVSFNPDFGPPTIEIPPSPWRLALIGGAFGMLGEAGEGCRDATFVSRAFSVSGAVRYQWQFRAQGTTEFAPLAGATNATLVIAQVTTAQTGEYRVVATNEQGSTTSEVAWLTVNPGPTILEGGQPRSLHTNACARVEFKVEAASCSSMRYQWRRDGISLVGAAGPLLVLTNVSPSDVGGYDVVVQNANLAITSSPPAQLTLDVAPRITEQPKSLERRDCDRAEFGVKATSSCPLQFQWLHNGAPIPGATGNPLVLLDLEPAHAGTYEVLVSNQFDGALSAAAVLTVATNPVLKTVVLQPANRRLRLCETARLTVSTDPSCTPLSYQWFHDDDPIPGSDTNALPFTVHEDSGGAYRVRVQNRWSAVHSAPVLLEVDTRPELTRQPVDFQRIKAGTTFSNTVGVTPCATLTYQWQFKRIDLPDFRPVALGGRFSLTTDGSLIVTQAATNETGFYRVLVSNNHSNILSREALIRVVVPPPNDDFARSVHLGRTQAATAAGHNEFATAQAAEPAPVFDAPSKTVWWSWTAPFPCVATVDLSGSDLDTLLAVQAGTQLTNLVRLTYDDNGGHGFASRAAFMAGRDRTVHFQVDGSGGKEGTNLLLTVVAQEITSPPIIPLEHQPKDAAARLGTTAAFEVQAYGSPEIRGQWFFNGAPMPGQTNLTIVGVTNYASSLVIPNVRDALEGVYRIVLTNEYGAATSRVATLTTGSIVRGLVTDATKTDPNGRAIPIPGARVAVGDIFDITDTNGNYQLIGVRLGQTKADFDANKRRVHLNEGLCFFNRSTATAVRLRATREGYYDYEDDQFEVSEGNTVEKRFSMSPIFEGRRFVLNWAESPADLDFWLRLPPMADAPPWIYYDSKGHPLLPPFAVLDVDVWDGYGPETLTIHSFRAGTYSLYVNKYAFSAGTLSQSLAKVIAYEGGRTNTTAYGAVEVPALGAGDWWHVCDIDGADTNIIWVNQLLAEPPVDPDTLPKEEGGTLATGSARRASLHAARPTDTDYFWSLGDGSPEVQAFETCYRYPDPGFYTIRLRMRGGTGEEPVELAETKVDFIEVVNLTPEVEILQPRDGWLVRAGDPIRFEAHADGVDDPIAQVEYFLVAGRTTNRVGSATAPPFAFTLPTAPGQNEDLRFVARATDQHRAIAWSAPVDVHVLDLSGEILVVRNRPSPAGDEEVNLLLDHLATMEIPIPVEDGFPRRQVPLVRVLDQEGLHFDLVREFRLIIWDDCGLPGAGVSPNTVAVLQQAWEGRIPLYLIGQHLGGDAASLAAEEAPEAVAPWLGLTRLAPTERLPLICEPALEAPRLENELFHSGWHGELDALQSAHPVEANVVLTNASQIPLCAGATLSALCIGDTQVRAVCGEAPLLVRTPRFGQENPLRAPRLSQTFLAGGGGNATDLALRQVLFRNAVLWLLGNYCENISMRLEDAEGLPEIRRATCEEFLVRTIINNNGACDAGGLLVTNTVPDGLQIRAVAIASEPPGANDGEVVQEGQQLVFGFRRLKTGSQAILEVTLRACLPGTFTNRFAGLGAHRRPPPWEQRIMVEGLACADCNPCEPRPLEIEQRGASLRIRATHPPGCAGTLEWSANLVHWQAASDPVISDDRGWLWTIELPTSGHQFYRLRMGP